MGKKHQNEIKNRNKIQTTKQKLIFFNRTLIFKMLLWILIP